MEGLEMLGTGVRNCGLGRKSSSDAPWCALVIRELAWKSDLQHRYFRVQEGLACARYARPPDDKSVGVPFRLAIALACSQSKVLRRF